MHFSCIARYIFSLFRHTSCALAFELDNTAIENEYANDFSSLYAIFDGI